MLINQNLGSYNLIFCLAVAIFISTSFTDSKQIKLIINAYKLLGGIIRNKVLEIVIFNLLLTL